MSLENISSNDKARLRETIDSGVGILQEIETLKGGLSDTLKALAEEMDIKPVILSRAVRAAFKSNIAEQKEQFDTVEFLLEAAGR